MYRIEQTKNELISKVGINNFNFIEIISNKKFDGKEKLIQKFYKLIIEDYLKVEDLIVDEENILFFKEGIESLNKNDKKEMIKNILSHYKENNKNMYIKYNRFFNKILED